MSFTPMTWEPLDLISDDKMDNLVNNIQWVNDNTPRAMYTSNTVTRKEGVKIASGRIIVPKKGKQHETSVEVNFPSFFTPGSSPNITTGINARSQQNIYAVFRGKPGTGLLPDNTGFQLDILMGQEDGEKRKIVQPFWVHWQAMGL